jgi:hypothetical protein
MERTTKLDTDILRKEIKAQNEKLLAQGESLPFLVNGLVVYAQVKSEKAA